MKAWLPVALLFLLFGRLIPFPHTRAEIAVVHATVIDVRNGRLDFDQTVLVSGNQIDEVGPSARLHVPEGARIVDARGKFLMPGLWDMHVHSLWTAGRASLFLPLFLANGVTGVREMGGPMPASDQVHWRDQVASGAVLGPRMVVSGPFVDGPQPIWPGAIKVSAMQDGIEAVDSLKMAGVDFVKVYTGVPRPAYFGIAAEAKKDGIPFVGHVPIDIGVDEASDAGQKSIEHLMGILLYCSSKSADLKAEIMKGTNVNALNDEFIETYDAGRASTLFALFVKNQTWQVPTLTVRHARPYLADLRAKNDPRLRYMPKDILDGWGARGDARQPTDPAVISSRKRLFQKELELVGAMHGAGVKFMAGTDTPNPYCFPGFGIHDELEFFVQAGLTPLQAIQTATVNPAEFLGLSKSLGSVEKGKVADLVLLDANPLEDISHTRQTSAVISNGRFFDRKALDEMLNDAAAMAGNNPAN